MMRTQVNAVIEDGCKRATSLYLGSLIILCSLLSACGGGGGAGGSISFDLNPTSISGSQYQEDSTSIVVGVTVTSVSGDISSPIYVVISGGSDAIRSQDVFVSQDSETAFHATIHPSASLSVGQHAGTLKVRLCSSPSCDTVYGGRTLPYNISVLSNTNLTPLSRINGAPEWQTIGGTAAHRNFVPITVDTTKLSSRWRWRAPFSGVADLGAVVTGNDFSYVMQGCATWAIRDSDGTSVWHSNTSCLVPDIHSLATVGGNPVFAAQNNQTNYLYSFDGLTGIFRYQATIPFLDLGLNFVVPFGQTLYLSTQDPNGGVVAFNDANNGQILWLSNLADGAIERQHTAAVDANRVVLRSSHAVYVLNPSIGIIASTIPSSAALPPFSPIDPPHLMPSGNELLVQSPPTVDSCNTQNFNLPLGTVQWSIPCASPAITDDVIYQLEGANLVAYNNTNGQPVLLSGSNWRWTTTDQPNDVSIVATNNIVFVSTGRTTYAIDRATAQQVWSYPHGGLLSISPNGLLYIVYRPRSNDVDDRGFVTAINLH